MSAKQKTISSKENWQAVRRPYLWHLRPPFDKEFDRTHWWNGLQDSKIKKDKVAALYELARRHPLVGEGLSTRIAMYAKMFGHDPTCPPAIVESRFNEITREFVARLREPHSLYCTCLVGLKSWAKLDYSERRNWEFEIGNMKGLDLRDEDLQCYSINKYAHWKIANERHAALEKKGQINDPNYEQTPEDREAERKKNLSVLHNDVAANPLTAEEWEVTIANRAVEAYRQGYIILAVVPDLKTDKAASVMAKTYRDHRRSYHLSQYKKRAWWESWLAIISEFENDEANTKQAEPQVFARYRRVLDGIQFA